MSIHEIFMPALSSTMTEGKIVSWEKSPGEKVEKGETVVVVESDKADMDVESFYEGYMAHILVEAGSSAPVGSAIAFLAETEAEIEAAVAQAKSTSAAPAAEVAAATAPGQTASSQPATVGAANGTAQNGNGRSGRTIASPRARKLAKEFKVDLSGITGSGPHGRIIAEDVETAAGKSTVKSTPQPATAPAPSAPRVTPAATPAPMPVAATPGQTVPLTTLRNAVVRTMNHSLSVPTFHVGYSIATDELNKLYKQIKSKGVTMTALSAKAVAMTLQKHPLLNTNYSEGAMVHPANINIAVAVAMDDGGLITPVLQNADQLDIYSLSRNWKSLVERARAKQLQPKSIVAVLLPYLI